VNRSAREIYLSSLNGDAELNARRIAERANIPDDDAIWLMLHELQQASREITRGANAALTNERFAQRLTEAVAASIVDDERINTAYTAGIAIVQDSSVQAIRALESEVRDVARKRAIAPISSLVFSIALALVAGFAAIWATYNVASGYGYDLGYHSGYHDGFIYERNHK
jgi:hypothetical protein